MKKRLFEKCDEGYTGWDSRINIESLAWRAFHKLTNILENDYYDKQYCVDIANFMMMVDFQANKK